MQTMLHVNTRHAPASARGWQEEILVQIDGQDSASILKQESQMAIETMDEDVPIPKMPSVRERLISLL
jgi:hypothetical protein